MKTGLALSIMFWVVLGTSVVVCRNVGMDVVDQALTSLTAAASVLCAVILAAVLQEDTEVKNG